MGMTREEAIKNIKEHCYFASLLPQAKEALDVAIKVLEQEPCEDAISRQEVLGVQSKYAEYVGATKFWQMRDDIKGLQPVTPQPKTGHWITDIDKWGDVVTTVNGYRCDKCNTFNSDKDNYCPNCGAKMIETQESEGEGCER